MRSVMTAATVVSQGKLKSLGPEIHDDVSDGKE
ncbi:uncharacterized protein METZ01_LOCUS135073 [marine metagenome]|uniref:Uncharacterized protein n=1 Tax=marine metagenome TaxID=408172 RepID=A0A381YZ41_9ZZZZ